MEPNQPSSPTGPSLQLVDGIHGSAQPAEKPLLPLFEVQLVLHTRQEDLSRASSMAVHAYYGDTTIKHLVVRELTDGERQQGPG